MNHKWEPRKGKFKNTWIYDGRLIRETHLRCVNCHIVKITYRLPKAKFPAVLYRKGNKDVGVGLRGNRAPECEGPRNG